MQYTSFLISFCLLLSFQAMAVETDWLEQQEGHQGKVIGATVKKVESGDHQLITIAIPKTSVSSQENIMSIT